MVTVVGYEEESHRGLVRLLHEKTRSAQIVQPVSAEGRFDWMPVVL